MIKREDIERVAHLARVKIAEKEIEGFQKDVGSILEFFETLKKAPTKSAEPMTHSVVTENVTRKDNAQENSEAGELVKMAAAGEKGFVKVRSPLS